MDSFKVAKDFKQYCMTTLNGWEVQDIVEDFYCLQSQQIVPVSFNVAGQKCAVVGLPVPIFGYLHQDESFVTRLKVVLMLVNNLQRTGWKIALMPISEIEVGRPFTRLLLRGFVESLLEEGRRNGQERHSKNFGND